MASGAQGRDSRFVEVDRGFHVVPVASRVFRGIVVDDT
jgi:hypothetical protein